MFKCKTEYGIFAMNSDPFNKMPFDSFDLDQIFVWRNERFAA